MPKCTGPLLSQSAVGTIGGMLYRTGTYGPIVSRSSSSPSIRTPAQSAHRGALKRAHESWLTLTDAERNSWMIHAPPQMTGRNLYVAAHIRLAPADIMPSPYYDLSVENEYLCDLVADVYGEPATAPPLLSIRWTPLGDPINVCKIWVYQTWSNRTLPKPSKFLLLATIALADGGTNLYLTYQSPVVWVRLEVVNWFRGSVTARHLLQATYHSEPPP